MSDDTQVFALPGTQCDSRLWSLLRKQPLDFVLAHLPIPQCENIEQMVSSLATQLPRTPFCLTGFSMGAYLAAAFGVRFPERIKKMCLLSNSPAELPTLEINQRRLLLKWITFSGYKGIPQSKIVELLHPINRHRVDLHTIIRDMDTALGVDSLIQQLEATTERVDLVPELMRISTPVHFVYGSADKFVNRSTINALNNKRKHVQTTIIDNAGHMLPLEAPAELAETLNHWFTEGKQ